MDNRPVAVIDSGIGGLPYLAWLAGHLPAERLVYVADRRSFPYGDKSPGEVRASVEAVARRLARDYDPKLLVVACNTASVLALDHLRQVFPLPVVGVVPAVKTAAGLTRNGRIGVLATRRTIEGGYLDDLIARFCPECQVSRWAASDIVTLVEDEFLERGARRAEVLDGWAATIAASSADTVVLGCTHFLHVADALSARLAGVSLVDNRDGVGRRVQALLAERDAFAAGADAGVSTLHFTADPAWSGAELAEHERKYRHFAAEFSLAYGGPWGDS